MNKILSKFSECIFKLQAIYSTMQRAAGLQFYYVIVDPKVAELHIYTKFSICTSFQVTGDFTHYRR